MAINVDSSDILIEVHDAIENEMYEKGYLTYGYIDPPEQLLQTCYVPYAEPDANAVWGSQ